MWTANRLLASVRISRMFGAPSDASTPLGKSLTESDDLRPILPLKGQANFGVKPILGSDLVLCLTGGLWIHDAADRRIVQAHGAADFRQTVAVFRMGLTDGRIAARAVRTSTGAE